MALVNRFSDENYQRRNWDHLQTTIKTTVSALIPHPDDDDLNPNPSELETLAQISQSINHTSKSLLSLNGNLVRGRGVFCTACFESSHRRHDHAAYAALVAIVNSKHPQIGHLLLRRLIFDIKEAHNSHNYATLSDLTNLLAHLVNQRVTAESLGFELVNLFLYSGDSPSDEVVTATVDFVKQCGASLRKADSDTLDGVLDRLRELLRERRNSNPLYRDLGDGDSRVLEITKTIESLRMSEFRNVLRVIPQLDILSEKERITHDDISFPGGGDEEEIETERELDVFRYDPNFFDAVIVDVRNQIEITIMSHLGGDNDDEAETNLRELSKRIQMKDNDVRSEICWMIVELCGQQEHYWRYFGELGRRMYGTCWPEVSWRDCFIEVYDKIEEYDTKKVENVGRLFGHLMVTHAYKHRKREDDEGMGIMMGTGMGIDMMMRERRWYGTSWEEVDEGTGIVTRKRIIYGMPWEHVLANLRLGDKTGSEAAPAFIKSLFRQLDDEIGLDERNEILAVLNATGFKIAHIFPKDDVYKLRFWTQSFKSVGLFVLAAYAQKEFAPILALHNLASNYYY